MIESLAAWLPLIFFLSVFVWISSRSISHYKEHVDEVNRVNQEIVDTNREMIKLLVEIRDGLNANKAGK